jgi:hypothetical protein
MEPIDGEQARSAGRDERPEALGAPVKVARHRQKAAYTLADRPREMIRRVANSRMEPGHEHLNALMDD